ncbi:transposase [Sorangium sp. So ce429]
MFWYYSRTCGPSAAVDDRVLLERTVALVRTGAMTEGERRAVSKALRVAIDSRPLAGAGRVEDTINLLGHAARSIVRVVSKITERPPEEICRKAGIPLLLAPSNQGRARPRLERPETEGGGDPDPGAAGLVVAAARDLDLPIIVACAVTPANRPEEEGAAPIAEDVQRQRLRLVELHIDRAYVKSPVVDDVIRAGGQVFSKPWGQRARSPDLFSKRHFKIDLRTKAITCPAGQVEVFEPGDTVEFDPEECGACPLRAKCTQAASGRGRTVSIAEDEALQGKFRRLQQTGPGRAVLRQTTWI